jgi:hypothetical protein
MNFNTITEIKNYLEKNTEYTVIKKSDFVKTKDMSWIYKEEGEKLLQGAGYFRRHEIKQKIGVIFNNWQCSNCRYQDFKEVCRICALTKNLIKNL